MVLITLAYRGRMTIDLAYLRSRDEAQRVFAGSGSQPMNKRDAPRYVRRVVRGVICIPLRSSGPTLLLTEASNQSLHFLVPPLPETTMGGVPCEDYVVRSFPSRRV